MKVIFQLLLQLIVQPVPEKVRDDFAVLGASHLQDQSRLLSLAMAFTVPFILYASGFGSTPAVRYGIPIAVGTTCFICFVSLIKDRNASGDPSLARQFMMEAAIFSASVCTLVSVWCIVGWWNASSTLKLFYPFTLAAGSLTTIYCLSTVRWAAIINIVIGIIPITILMLFSGERIYISAAISLIMVTFFLFRMVTQQNKQFINLLLLQHEMKELAETDPLTGLYNRRALSEFLEKEIAQDDIKETFSVALIDLDDFKPVNDQYGHAIGDKLLVEVSKRLQNVCGEDAIAARMGGDEFAVLTLRDSSLHHDQVANLLLSSLIVPCNIDGHIINISASVGVAVWPHDGVTAKALFEIADQALYAAKEVGPYKRRARL